MNYEKIFKEFINNGVIIVGCVFLTKEGKIVSRVISPNIIIDVLKSKPDSAIKIQDGLYDSRKHLCKQLDELMDHISKGCNIPIGRSPAQYTVKNNFLDVR